MYHVEFAPDAEADLARLNAPIAQQVLKRLVWLAENFDVIRPAALTGRWQDYAWPGQARDRQLGPGRSGPASAGFDHPPRGRMATRAAYAQVTLRIHQ